jgi:trk system potassium uptake protein TrkA
MQVIVIGCGKVGSNLANQLFRDGHDVVIVDEDGSNFYTLPPEFNGITITGVPIDQDVLKQAGIETADALAAVTPDDNVNIMVCQVAREIFNVPRVIARIYNPEREHVFHQFGLETICPTNMTVDAVMDLLADTECGNTHYIFDTPIRFSKLPVMEEEVGRTIGALRTASSSVLGLIRGGRFAFLPDDTVLERGDVLVTAFNQEGGSCEVSA